MYARNEKSAGNENEEEKNNAIKFEQIIFICAFFLLLFMYFAVVALTAVDI